jgi:threonine synthase
VGFVKGLKCRECTREYAIEPIYVCEFCFGPLEVVYDYDGIKKVLTKKKIESRPQNLWRYKELLPIDKEPTSGLYSGFTPLVKAEKLAKHLGLKELYIKDDTVTHPTLSFKDRVVAIALSKAREFGFDTVACASTGNLAHSVSAHGAAGGFQRYIFIPATLERSKIIASLAYEPNLIAVDGNYDDVNRLCSEVANKYNWAFVNINIRPFYAEGSKTQGYEIVEQLGWRVPDAVVVPCASGSLMTKIWKSFREMKQLGLIEEMHTKVFAAQATGCSPIVKAIKDDVDVIKPVKPATIAKSLAIGNPADGFYATKVINESGGFGADVSDDEIVDAIKLLAATEGIFSETAGGVTLASAIKLIESGRIAKDDVTVLSITGNGLKTKEAIVGRTVEPYHIDPNLKSFEQILNKIKNR